MPTLSPWEQAHGNHPYDPNSPDNAENDFDRATAAYYGGQNDNAGHPDVNWYAPSTYNWLINTPGAQKTPPPDPPSTGGPKTAGPTPTWGGPPAPFGERYTTLARPSYLQGEYKAPTWQGGDFVAPTMDSVVSEPGYQTGLNTGIQAQQRGAAAKGSILNGGTQKALTRFGTDYGATKYGEAFGRAFQTYQQKYGQFVNSTAQAAQARGLNETAYAADVANNASQYGTRYQGYLDTITNARNAQNDYWNEQMDLAKNGLTAAGLARPGTPT